MPLVCSPDARFRSLQGPLERRPRRPERPLTPRFLQVATRLPVGTFAIDEPHFISQWGHDFWAQYRQLAELPNAFSSHAPFMPTPRDAYRGRASSS